MSDQTVFTRGWQENQNVPGQNCIFQLFSTRRASGHCTVDDFVFSPFIFYSGCLIYHFHFHSHSFSQVVLSHRHSCPNFFVFIFFAHSHNISVSYLVFICVYTSIAVSTCSRSSDFVVSICSIFSHLFHKKGV